MTEYITKEQAFELLGDGDMYGRIALTEMKSADVIERSKVDKAIEELEKEIKENHLNVIEYSDAEWILKDFVYGAIDRLKRNIGKQIL